MDEIEELEDILDSLFAAVQQAIQSGEELTPEIQNMIAAEINYLTNEIDTLYQQQQQPQEQPAPIDQANLGAAPSPDAQLLWILAGQQEQPFINYLRTYPTPATQALLQNPTELSRVIDFLSQMMPPGQPLEMDGIEHAPLNSSNVWGAKYDPKSGKMLVRFQGGSIYEYSGIPANIFRAFISGNAEARSNGQNQYGRWWRGKNPSLGAALNQYIKAGGFAYNRLR